MVIDPQILETLRFAQKKKMRISLSFEASDVSFQSLLVDCRPDCLIVKNPVPFEMIHEVVGSSQVSMLSHHYRFVAPGVESDGVHMILRPHAIDRVAETRGTERLPFDDQDHVACSFVNPYDGQTELSYQVMDISAGGLSIWVPRATKLFKPQAVIDQMKISIGSDRYFEGIARTVYARKTIDLNSKLGMQVGFELKRF